MNRRSDDSNAAACPRSPDASPTLEVAEGNSSVYRTRHDMTTDGLSITISQALAEVSDVTVTELVQDFSEFADPDALDRLFRSPVTDPDKREDGYIVLPIRGYHVTIYGDGRILIVDVTP